MGSTQIAREFGKAAEYYDRHAEVQRAAAERLIGSFRAIASELPPGPLLEVGCGTGFLTRGLLDLRAGRPAEITDLSEQMVAFSRDRWRGTATSDPSFGVLDAERMDPGPRWAGVVAGFVAQWFRDPGRGLARLSDSLVPGGSLVASVPVVGSFPEWRRASENAAVPFHGAELPSADDVLEGLASSAVDISSFEEDLPESHASPLDFLRHLKRIGAATRIGNGAPLSPSELGRLVDAWDAGPHQPGSRPTRVTYRVLFLVARRRTSE